MVGSSGRRAAALAALAALVAGLAACGGDDGDAGGGGLSGTIRIDGSSTVAPLSEAAAELFQAENRGVRVTVGTSGTGGGFERFCRGETDISDASRRIEDDEVSACRSAGISFEEIAVANDGISLVVNPGNDWARCLTVAELRRIWDRGSSVRRWSDVRPGFPDEPIELYGPGTDSGTFDYFTEAVNGEEGRQRTQYNNVGEDDNATVTGVSGDEGAMGYFGYSFLAANSDKVRAVQIRNEDGACVAPSEETIRDGSYKPLSRQLFVYPSGKALAREEVERFLEFYIERNDEIAAQAALVGLTSKQQADARAKVDRLAQSHGGATTTAAAPE